MGWRLGAGCAPGGASGGGEELPDQRRLLGRSGLAQGVQPLDARQRCRVGGRVTQVGRGLVTGSDPGLGASLVEQISQAPASGACAAGYQDQPRSGGVSQARRPFAFRSVLVGAVAGEQVRQPGRAVGRRPAGSSSRATARSACHGLGRSARSRTGRGCPVLVTCPNGVVLGDDHLGIARLVDGYVLEGGVLERGLGDRREVGPQPLAPLYPGRRSWRRERKLLRTSSVPRDPSGAARRGGWRTARRRRRRCMPRVAIATRSHSCAGRVGSARLLIPASG